MAKCKSCGADITFARTPKGKLMPVDSKPEKRVLLDGDGHDEPVARIVNAYTPHWVTCLNAAQHRKAKRGGWRPPCER